MVHGNGEIVDGFLCSGSPYDDDVPGRNRPMTRKRRAR